MEALPVDDIPVGEGWQYEPKWDGFRCLIFRDGSHVELQSKSCKSLTRYFPDIVAAAKALTSRKFVLDGELAVPHGMHLSFDDLLQRIHPAASRVVTLAKQTPALFIAFDLLSDGKASLQKMPLAQRRPALEEFARRNFSKGGSFRLSPATTKIAQARKGMKGTGAVLDGVVAKRLDMPYRAGERDGMQKIKRYRSADCVVGGFRYNSGTRVVGSLLLGLYDDKGLLNHVGFTSSIARGEKQALTKKLEKLVAPPGFTGDAPGGPSRWSTERSAAWNPLKPSLVVEVCFDHFSGGRFRHGTTLIRWRPDKDPSACTIAQVEQEGRSAMKLLAVGGRR
jgi:ATP-dependent DNA ligase